MLGSYIGKAHKWTFWLLGLFLNKPNPQDPWDEVYLHTNWFNGIQPFMWASIPHMDPMWNMLILMGPYMNQPVTPSCFTKDLFLNLPIGVRLWWRRWNWSTVPWAFLFGTYGTCSKIGLLQWAYKGRFLRHYSGVRRKHSQKSKDHLNK